MKTSLALVLAASLAMISGCVSHTYTAPVVGAYTIAGESQDVAWILEDDGHHILRCVESPQGPTCLRASVH